MLSRLLRWRPLSLPPMATTPKKPPTRVIITRHGQTVTNKEGRFCGHAETELTEMGQEQARALGRRLADVQLAGVYTSGLGRAVLTAHLAAGNRELTPVVDPDLRELHYGEWELMKGTLVARRYPDQHKLMRAEDPLWHPPGGENVEAVRLRTYAALQRILKRHKNETVLIVSHGTAINCMLSVVMGVAVTHNFRFGVTNCSYSEVELRGQHPVVTVLNDTSHLAGIKSPAES